jgi:hypothetical protein
MGNPLQVWRARRQRLNELSETDRRAYLRLVWRVQITAVAAALSAGLAMLLFQTVLLAPIAIVVAIGGLLEQQQAAVSRGLK